MESSDALVFQGEPKQGWTSWDPENTIYLQPCPTIKQAREFLEAARIKVPEGHIKMAIVRKYVTVNGTRIPVFVAAMWDKGCDNNPEHRKSIPEARKLRDNPGRKHGANKYRPAIEKIARGQ